MEIETPKKRKRDATHPVVCYDAESRTFDRVFKEDSLDAMKDVVRKKLNIPSSTPLFLAQVRDGQTVDLEDDEDFEAFSAFARISLAVKVKVIQGQNANASAPIDRKTNVPVSISVGEGRKRKKKKKKRFADANTESTSVVNAPQHLSAAESSPETELPLKKRRVSFAEPPPLHEGRNKAESSKKSDVETSATSSKKISNEIQKPTLADSAKNSEGGEDIPDTSKKEKRKRKKEKTTFDEGQSVPEASETKTKKKKKGNELLDSSDASKITQVPTAIDETLQNNTSKKRPRDEPSTEETSVETSATIADANAKSNDEPPAKKSKKKSAKIPDSADAGIEPTPGPQPPPSDVPSSSLPVQPLDQVQDSKKTKRKKDKTVVEEGLTTDAEKNDAEISKKPKKSTVSKLDSSTVEQSSSVGEKTKKSKSTVDSDSSNKKVTDAVPQNPSEVTHNTSSDVGAGTSKEGQKGGKEVEVDEANIEKDVTAVKAPKKTSKKKKDLVDNTNPTGANEDVAVQESAKLSRLDAARARMEQMVAAKQAEQPETQKTPRSEPANKRQSSKKPLDLMETPNPPADDLNQTTQQDDEHPDEAPIPQAESSTTVESISTKDTSEKSDPTSKSEKPPAPCPVCGVSPFHARSRCRIIKSGIKAMRKRITELEEDATEATDDHRSAIIAELQTLIAKKTKKPRASDVVKPVNPVLVQESEADVADLELAAAEASATLPKKPRKSRVSEVTKTPVSHVEPPIAPEAEAQAAEPSPNSLPVLKPPPATQPGSKTRSSSSQATNQSPLSIQASSSNKAANSSQNPFLTVSPLKVSEGPLQLDFLAFGDVSQYSEKDIQALIRGPRPSQIQDIPESDTDDDNDQEEEEAVLEEDDVQEAKLPRNASRIEYPSSSDAGDDDDDDEEEEKIAAPKSSQRSHDSQADVQADGGDLSFRDVDEDGSSVEPDNSGDVAANAAVDADLAPIAASNQREDSEEKDSDDDDSNAPTESKADNDNERPILESMAPSDLPAPPHRAEADDAHDPIESSDDPSVPPPSQPEQIASDDDAHPFESTPKVEVTTRTRSQRVKAQSNAKTATPAATQPAKSSDDPEEVVRPARKTRSLTKLTEMPVPPNPSARMIRPSATPAPRTRRQLATAREQSQDREATPGVPETAGRTLRATATRAAKTPAKTPAKASKTPAKPPAGVTKVTTAKPLSKQAPPQSPPKTQAKPAATQVESDESESEVSGGNNAANASVAEWEVLQDNAASQVDTDATAMVDELLPSPKMSSSKSTRNSNGHRLNGSSQGPLFFPAESQQSFPYSQYPDLHPGTQAAISTNDSDDEEEVLAAVVKPSAPLKQPFPSLRAIASQVPNFLKPRLSQYAQKAEEPADMYGQSGKQSDDEEDSATDSDSGTENKSVSHIPTGRLAGTRQTKKT